MNYSDIDYCLKLRHYGWRAVYTPHAELYHFESMSREATVCDEDRDLFLSRWSEVTLNDPYYNGHNLETAPPDFSLRLSPLRGKPTALKSA
jgi:O-antigen biosynthesis protein